MSAALAVLVALLDSDFSREANISGETVVLSLQPPASSTVQVTNLCPKRRGVTDISVPKSVSLYNAPCLWQVGAAALADSMSVFMSGCADALQLSVAQLVSCGDNLHSEAPDGVDSALESLRLLRSVALQIGLLDVALVLSTLLRDTEAMVMVLSENKQSRLKVCAA